MNAVQIVSADQYSLEALTDLYNRTRADYLVPMGMTVETMRAYIQRHDISLTASWVAEVSGVPLGMGMLGLRDRRAWLTRLGVVGEARRYGLGQMLVEALIESARTSGVSVVQLEVITGNAAGQHLFRACGFEPVRRLLVLERTAHEADPWLPLPERTLDHDEVMSLLNQPDMGYAPSWVEEPASVGRARRLAGIGLDSAALIYGEDGQTLTPVVLCGADEVTGPALLGALHHPWPQRPALKENLPTDSLQAAWFAVAGYALAFERLEMARAV